MLNNRIRTIRNPHSVLLPLIYKTARLWPDKLYLQMLYRLLMHKPLNLKNPKSFNEKLQWLKLYNRKPEHTLMVDKLKVKDYVASLIGEEYIIPTLGVWENAKDVDFNSLPDKFVIKCNHNSGQGLYICKNKSEMNEAKVRSNLQKALETDYFIRFREWPYKDVERRIIAEKYIEDKSSVDGDLKDYKFMCFNGKVHCSFVCSERKTDLKVSFFDRDWMPMPFERHYPRSNKPIPKPVHYEEMITLAEALSQGIPFVRVDFYDVEDKIYFGELTFFPGSGFEEFTPEIWDERLGSLINIS